MKKGIIIFFSVVAGGFLSHLLYDKVYPKEESAAQVIKQLNHDLAIQEQLDAPMNGKQRVQLTLLEADLERFANASSKAQRAGDSVAVRYFNAQMESKSLGIAWNFAKHASDVLADNNLAEKLKDISSLTKEAHSKWMADCDAWRKANNVKSDAAVKDEQLIAALESMNEKRLQKFREFGSQDFVNKAEGRVAAYQFTASPDK